jgi:hypothetical protein
MLVELLEFYMKAGREYEEEKCSVQNVKNSNNRTFLPDPVQRLFLFIPNWALLWENVFNDNLWGPKKCELSFNTIRNKVYISLRNITRKKQTNERQLYLENNYPSLWIQVNKQLCPSQYVHLVKRSSDHFRISMYQTEQCHGLSKCFWNIPYTEQHFTISLSRVNSLLTSWR